MKMSPAKLAGFIVVGIIACGAGGALIWYEWQQLNKPPPLILPQEAVAPTGSSPTARPAPPASSESAMPAMPPATMPSTRP